MKPFVAHNVPASVEAIERIVGPRLKALFVRNPAVAEYGSVLIFTHYKVVPSGPLKRAIDKHSVAGKATLCVGRDFTVEARALAAETGCDVMAEREFGWTDERWLNRSN